MVHLTEKRVKRAEKDGAKMAVEVVAVESKKLDNKLFYTCSLIEQIGRDSNNERFAVVQALGKENIARIYEYSDVFHCERIEAASAKWREKCDIVDGGFDNISTCRYRLPTCWDIGKVYCRLIQSLGGDPIDTLVEVYSSWLAPKIDNYNIAVYYMSSAYLFESYKEGNLLEA